MEQIQNGESSLLRSNDSGISTLTLNRPDYNFLSIKLLKELENNLLEIAKNKAIRVVIIEAKGKAFCAGHDLREMRAYPSEKDIRNLFSQCSKMMMSITKIPQPVIAKINGTATAAGCQLVAQCDLAIASVSSKFGTSGVNIGLFCSTPMVAVTRNLTRKHAMELLLTGDLINASEAEKLGLINRAVPAQQLDNEVHELATKIANKSPLAISLGKELFYKQIEEDMGTAYKSATDVITCNMMSDDAKSGIDSFLFKKPLPNWEGK